MQRLVKQELLAMEILVAAVFEIPGIKCLFNLSNYTRIV